MRLVDETGGISAAASNRTAMAEADSLLSAHTIPPLSVARPSKHRPISRFDLIPELTVSTSESSQ